MIHRLALAALGTALVCSPAVAADTPAGPAAAVDWRGEVASADATRVTAWVATSGDNQDLPFIVVDKVRARVFLFDHRARLRGVTAALLGLGRGDDTVPGIGQRKLATIRPDERTTPAGRFVASLGNDYTQDILWVDYDAGVSLHRVITGAPKDRRRERLASPSALDNRISYGCINVPAAFYDKLIMPAFAETVGVVYILPESKSLDEVFAMHGSSAHALPAGD